MQKKFFDIIPPKEERNEIKEESIEIPVKKREKKGTRFLLTKRNLVPLEKKRFRFPKALVGVVIIAFLALIVAFFLPNDVEIKVWPVMRDIISVMYGIRDICLLLKPRT